MNYTSKKLSRGEKKINLKNYIRKIRRSLHILKTILNHLTKRKLLIIKYNNSIKQKLEINLNNYDEFSKIEIEVITTLFQ